MIAPRIEIDLSKIRYNTRHLVERLKTRGITVTGVTKAVCGHPAIANAMLEGGAVGLAEARIANAERMRSDGITCPISMIRTPTPSQVDRVVESCETSFNTEPRVITQLAAAALQRHTVHNVILMVEMGDMREGVLPEDLNTIAQIVLRTPGVALKGIGANFFCLNKVTPNSRMMTRFSVIGDETEDSTGSWLETISGGNSSNLAWALGADPVGRTNNLRIGEAILLGRDPISGHKINGLYSDAFSLAAEVIETKTNPESVLLQFRNPSLSAVHSQPEESQKSRLILAIGQQDTDVTGLTFPAGVTFIGATSDHLIVESTNHRMQLGSEIQMQMNYSALMRVMSAPDVEKVVYNEWTAPRIRALEHAGPSLVLI